MGGRYCNGTLINRMGWRGLDSSDSAKDQWPSILKAVINSLISAKCRKCWIKRDQLDVTCFIISLFNAQHVSDVNTSILRSLRLICWAISWVLLLWFDVCWCYVFVWLGWCGIRMQVEELFNFNPHSDTTPPQTNHKVTPTHIEP